MKNILFLLNILIVFIIYNGVKANEQKADETNAFYVIKVDNKYGYIDKNGTVTIEPRFEEGFDFKEGMARVKIDKKWGFINKNGDVAIRAVFQNARDFSESLAAIEMDGKWGFIDLNGQIRIPAKYENAFSFREGMAKISDYQNTLIQRLLKWGYINKLGEVVIVPQFNTSGAFCGGLAASPQRIPFFRSLYTTRRDILTNKAS